MLAKIMIPALLMAIAGCSVERRPSAGTTLEQGLARQIEIDVEDLERGLPCRVVDRRPPGTQTVLWRAEYEEGFCHRKAEETRLIMQQGGWACRPLNSSERQDLAPRGVGQPHVVAAWRCLEGLTPLEKLAAVSPPIPVARPAPNEETGPTPDDELLHAAVERDLTTIGQNMLGEDTLVLPVFGDLNDDGIEDAIVVLTRGIDDDARYQMLMAYLRSDDDYNLVDVWSLQSTSSQRGDHITPRIENGKVHLGDCCEDGQASMTLVLEDRKFAYADDD